MIGNTHLTAGKIFAVRHGLFIKMAKRIRYGHLNGQNYSPCGRIFNLVAVRTSIHNARLAL